MMITRKLLGLITCAGLALSAQFASSDSLNKGADVGWLTEMEASGRYFYNAAGVQQDVFTTFKENGMDAVRLRVWVNPPAGYNGINDVLAKAQRVKAAGLKLMVDFHYSDDWADPAHQTKPVAWAGYTQQQLMDAVWNHTRNSLITLRNAGITPDWVQVGNETNDGMLWGTSSNSAGGRASVSMQNYAWLTATGYNAVKDIFPSALVIIHLSNCHDNALFHWIFDGLKNNGGKFDVIAASNYPALVTTQTWQQVNTACAANLTDMAATYNVPVMVAEIGTPWDQTDAKAVVADMTAKLRAIPNNKGIGIFYWEPEAYGGWKGYNWVAYDPTGKPTATLNAFLEPSAATRIKSVSNGKCSEISGNSIYSGAWVMGAASCTTATNQMWALENMQGDYYRLKVGSTKMCMDLASQSTTDLVNVIQATCSAGNSQQWLKEDMGSGQYRLHNRFSDKCIAVRADNFALVQYTCSATGADQRFTNF